MRSFSAPLTMNLQDAGIQDIALVGGKNASLGEMLQHLSGLGIQIPGGFIVTVAAYKQFLSHNKLEDRIADLLIGLDAENVESLWRCGRTIRQWICQGEFTESIVREIASAYVLLSADYREEWADVAVRSSATTEDLPDASFAGQQETFLNIRGKEGLLEAVKQCFASLFTDRAISYRQRFGFDHFQIGISVCVQKMVRSDMAASGVAFSLDTESGFKNAVIINGSYGLGEMIVQGSVSPDEWIVFKPTLLEGFAAIIEKKRGSKEKKMVYGDPGEESVKIIPTASSERNDFCVSDTIVLQLARWVIEIENYYSRLKQRWCPMDIEWAVDGRTEKLYILQARPETIHSRKKRGVFTEYTMQDQDRAKKLLLTGIAVGDKIASGKVTILNALEKRQLHTLRFKEGDVLVTDMTDPDWEPLMKKAAAIITNKGGRTCHAAIVARELGLPAIVGCGNATSLLTDDQWVTVSCAEGQTGQVYGGDIPFEKQEFDLEALPKIQTSVLLNVASPDMAFHFAHLPCDGVGLAREEFIINNYIRVHPLALLYHQTLGDQVLTKAIHEIIHGFQNGASFFVEKLTYGIAKIAAAFYPRKVIVRFSDFKSNEYFNLLGGNYFEPTEENPMLGWRGASRYYSPEYKEAFGLECKAIGKVRETLGLDNVVVMIPFCRTVHELIQVYDTMREFGLERGKNGLEVYLMAELPSNIIMAHEFAQQVDGFSIGSNDLTQLILGLDRDSSLVSHLYDERDEAVKWMIRGLIATAKKTGVKVGICGQGPSDFPDFAQFLVELGIDTISVTPDAYFKTVRAIDKIEQVMLQAGDG